MIRQYHRRVLAVLVGASLVAASCSSGSAGTTTEPAATEPAATAPDDGTAAPDDPDTSDTTTVAPLEDADQITSQGEGGNSADLVPVKGGEITFAFANDGTGFDTTGAVAPGSIRVITAMND